MIIPAGGGEPVASFLLPPQASDLEWVPDGSAITYIDAGRGWSLMRQPIEGGDPVPVTEFTEGRVLGHEWSPDGRRLSVVQERDGQENIWLLAADGGEASPLTDFKTGRIREQKWALDSARLSFTYGDTSQDVVLITEFR
jgi:Tol biopolymer transport system component